MKPLLAKEIRLLLPAYAMALILAVAPLWLFTMTNSYLSQPEISIISLLFGAVMLALSVFGREFGLKTFPLLLAQPLERQRIWLTKIAILAVAMASIYVTWYLAGLVFYRDGWDRSDGLQVRAVGWLILATAFSGGLWTTLLLRQVAAAFWITIGVPVAILIIIGLSGGTGWTAVMALGLYSVVGFWLAWWLFFRAQETAWTGGVISLPGWRLTDAARSADRVRRPMRALFGKELQLHQVSLAGMGCLFVLHLAVVALRKTGHDKIGDTMQFFLESFGVIWLVVPLLIGSLSVAEERQLGTAEGHLCLPVSRRVQFAVKLLFVLVLGGLLSAVLLWTAEGIGSAIGAGTGALVYLQGNLFMLSFTSSTLAFISLLFLILALIGFYASTLARNIVQALAAAVVAAIAVWMLVGMASRPMVVWDIRLWQGSLMYYIALPTLLLTFVWFAFRNFKRGAENGGLWGRNVIGLTIALVFIVCSTAAVYNRAWELFTPLEPAHGPARLTQGKLPELKSYGGSALTLVLADGRLWVDRIAYIGGRWNSLDENHFMAGSNWLDGVANFSDTVAIRADGTLWVSEKPRQPWDGTGKLPAIEPDSLVQFGNETNWQSIVRDHGLSVVLLKREGTLWCWGTAGFPENRTWPGLRAYQPRRLGTESDWAKIMPTGAGAYAWKRDGRTWVVHPRVQPRNKKELAGPEIARLASLDDIQWRSLTYSLPFDIGVRKDGTLWAWILSRSADGQVDGGLATHMEQIGKETNWVTVTAHVDGEVVAAKADGTLWKWEGGNEPIKRDELTKQAPVRLGTHNDWVAVGSAMGGIVSLAADGSLWYWCRRESYYYGSADQPLLAASRKPSRIENVLGQ